MLVIKVRSSCPPVCARPARPFLRCFVRCRGAAHHPRQVRHISWLMSRERPARLSFRKRPTDAEKAGQHDWRFATTAGVLACCAPAASPPPGASLLLRRRIFAFRSCDRRSQACRMTARRHFKHCLSLRCVFGLGLTLPKNSRRGPPKGLENAPKANGRRHREIRFITKFASFYNKIRIDISRGYIYISQGRVPKR